MKGQGLGAQTAPTHPANEEEGRKRGGRGLWSPLPGLRHTYKWGSEGKASPFYCPLTICLQRPNASDHGGSTYSLWLMAIDGTPSSMDTTQSLSKAAQVIAVCSTYILHIPS